MSSKTGAPAGANNYVLCERCYAVKERRRCRMCNACGAAYQKERQRLRGQSRKKIREARYRSAGLAPTRPAPDRCEICERQDYNRKQAKPRHLALDHCHKTGKFRGWVCLKCNLAIAHFGDTREGVQRVIDYFHRAETANKETKQ